MDLIETGSLSMDPDTGLVWRKPADCDDDHEYLGYIEDDDNMPPDLWPEWEWLKMEWRDRGNFTRACAATAAWSYYDRLSIPGVN